MNIEAASPACPLENGDSEIEQFVSLLHSIDIDGDLASRPELKTASASAELKEIRYFDAAKGKLIASLRNVGRKPPFCAEDVAEVMILFPEYRGTRWTQTSIKNFDGRTLEIELEFEPVGR